MCIDAARVDGWSGAFANASVGLRCGHLVGLDIDILDPDLAHQAQALAFERLGQTLIRIGQYPKRLLLYRTTTPFAKIKTGKIELLGLGQQFVAFGLHPATGRPYEWVTGDSPLDVALDDLPAIDKASVAAVLAEMEPRAARLTVTRVQSGLIQQGLASATHAQQVPMAQVRDPVRDATGLVKDGRDGWLSSIAYHAVQDARDAGQALEPDVLTRQVWDRFVATTMLERARKDGQSFYELSDAARKIADKLRLLEAGLLPPRNAGEVPPPPALPELDVTTARARLSAAISEFAQEVRDFWVSSADTPPRLALRATVGLGKSTIARQALLSLQADLRQLGHPHRILIFVPSHALAEDAAAAWQAEGASVAVLRGYDRKDPKSGRPMCQRMPTVRAALADRRNIQATLCGQSAKTGCRYFARCLKQQNRRDVAAADIVFAPYDAMFLPIAEAGHDAAVVVVDEACWQRAITLDTSLSLADLRAGSMRGVISRSDAFAADMQNLRQRAADALDAANGIVTADDLIAAGLNCDDCRRARDGEYARLQRSELRPDLDGAAEASAIASALRNADIHRYITFWSALITLLDAVTPQVIRLKPDVSPAEDRGIEIIGTRRLDAQLTNLPLLHLDATLRPELVTPILPGCRFDSVEAAAPHQYLHLVTGRFDKSKLAAGATPDGRPGSLLQDCIDHVRWLSATRPVSKTLLVTHKAFTRAFAGFPDVECAHFNSVAGIDRWKGIDRLIIIGRPLPSTAALEPMGLALFGQQIKGRYQTTQASAQLMSHSTVALSVLRHEDEMAEVLRAAICDDELIQVIGRGRGVNRTAENPLEVMLFADVALPLGHDSVTAWESLRPGTFERMCLCGVATDSPKDAAAAFPEMFANEEQAKKAMQRESRWLETRFKGQTPYIYKRPLSLKSARYRRGGRGRSWQRAWWLSSMCADPRDWLATRIGALAQWQDDEPVY